MRLALAQSSSCFYVLIEIMVKPGLFFISISSFTKQWSNLGLFFVSISVFAKQFYKKMQTSAGFELRTSE